MMHNNSRIAIRQRTKMLNASYRGKTSAGDVTLSISKGSEVYCEAESST